MATYSFGAVGLSGLAEGSFGYLQVFSITENADEAVIQNSSGNVVKNHFFNRIKEIEAEYIFDAETTTPDVGDTVIVGGEKYSVVSVSKEEKNNEFKRVTIRLKRYVSGGAPE